MRSRQDCPRCGCELDVRIEYYEDDGDTPFVEVRTVPFEDVPCSSFEVPTFIVGVGGRVRGWIRCGAPACEQGDGSMLQRDGHKPARRRFGGRCNWLPNDFLAREACAPVLVSFNYEAFPIDGLAPGCKGVGIERVDE
jgi:hypothetical protein